MDRAPDFRIAPSARRLWEHHGVPHTIEEVVEAIFDQPVEARRSIRFEVLPLVVHVIPSVEALGRRFCVLGIRDREERWKSFHEVRPL